MATANKNAKSQLTTVRVPHDVMDGMEAVKQDGESNAGFIVTAMQGEIARRQLKESGEDKLLSKLNGALETLTRIEQAGTLASESLRVIVGTAQSEIRHLQGKPVPEDSSETKNSSETPTTPVEESLGHRIRRSKF